MALSANAQVNHFVDQEVREFPVGAAVHIYRGGNAGLDPAGYLKAFEPGDLFAGIAYEESDNTSGAAGAKNCRVYVQGDFELTITGVALTDIDAPVFATADDAQGFTGHPDAYMGKVVNYLAASTALVRLRAWGEKPPNGIGSIELVVTGHEHFTGTGATAGDEPIGRIGGFEIETILGPGVTGPTAAENAGITMAFDSTSEVALASVRMPAATLPVDKGVTFECELCLTVDGAAATDLDFGLGTALTTNSEADIDHADMVQLACFHINGGSDNILAQSDDDTTDVAVVDTGIDNDDATDIAKKFKIIVRPDGEVEFWIAGARVLSTTAFAVLSTADLAGWINLEKTAATDAPSLIFRNLRVAGGAAAQ